MDQHHSDNLPPELDELGQRMSTERPVASDRALDRVMTRARGARGARKPSLLWRSTAPRARRKSLALGVAGILATAGTIGMTMGAANAQPYPPPPEGTSCSTDPISVFVLGTIDDNLLALIRLQIPLDTLGPGPIVVLQTNATVGGLNLVVCLAA